VLTQLSFLKKAVLHPEPAPDALPLWRHLLLKPILFEGVATLMQIGDLRRVRGLPAYAAGGDAYFASVADYNAGVTRSKAITVSRAAEPLLKILSLRWPGLRAARLLVIGPRTVQELYLAWLYGFAWSNIHAIDLYATNPKIKVMNMEAMAFPDASFDAVLASKTVSYAKDLARCIGEMARVLKPGGRAVFTHSHSPDCGEFRAARADEAELRRIIADCGLQAYFFHSFSKQSTGDIDSNIHTVGVLKA
jgi:SAM-dependent methyltransferase